MGIVVSFLIIPSIIRSVIVSGYLIYPYSSTAVNVTWRVPTFYADGENASIRAWARAPLTSPEETLSGWSWFYDRWLWNVMNGDNFFLFLLPSILFSVSTPFFALRYSRFRRRSRGRYLLLLAIILIAIAFWFVAAPNVRFAGVTIWALPLLIISLITHTLKAPPYRRVVGSLAVIMLLFCLPPHLWKPIDTGFSPLPEPDLGIFEFGHGDVAYYPLKTDQCWNAPLP